MIYRKFSMAEWKRKTLNNNDLDQVADQRFLLKQWFAGVLILVGSEKLVLPIVVYAFSLTKGQIPTRTNIIKTARTVNPQRVHNWSYRCVTWNIMKPQLKCYLLKKSLVDLLPIFLAFKVENRHFATRIPSFSTMTKKEPLKAAMFFLVRSNLKCSAD